MGTTLGAALLTLGTLASARAATAQAPPAAAPPAPVQVRESKPGLLRRASIDAGTATRTALRQVANGQIREAEIEQEHGRLVYSYDVKVPGRSGIDEVLVDAKTGAVVSHTHESAAAEAAEARADARAAEKSKPARRRGGTR